jgi:hypothetical protein
VGLRATDDLASSIKVVSVRDPAIDWGAMWDEGVSPAVYAETRGADVVRAIPGMRPRWFVLRALSVADCTAVEMFPEGAPRAVQAFRVACTAIENFDQGIAVLAPTLAAASPHGVTRTVWGDDDLQRVADVLGMRAIYEVGSIAYERALEGNVRGGGVSYTLPPFLLPELQRIVRRLAEREPPTDGTRSSEPSASDSTTTL